MILLSVDDCLWTVTYLVGKRYSAQAHSCQLLKSTSKQGVSWQFYFRETKYSNDDVIMTSNFTSSPKYGGGSYYPLPPSDITRSNGSKQIASESALRALHALCPLHALRALHALCALHALHALLAYIALQKTGSKCVITSKKANWS